MSDETTLLKAIMDEFEHECFMLRVEASETRARDDVVRKSYERIRDEFAGRITATLGNGKLTADDIRDLIERHSAWVIGNNRCFRNGAYEAIADELNALIGGGECVIARIAAGSDMGRCSACGQIADIASNYCWRCGAKNERR